MCYRRVRRVLVITAEGDVESFERLAVLLVLLNRGQDHLQIDGEDPHLSSDDQVLIQVNRITRLLTLHNHLFALRERGQMSMSIFSLQYTARVIWSTLIILLCL